LQLQIEKQRRGRLALRPDFRWIGDDKIIASTRWTGEDGHNVARFQVITIRNGKIVDMQGCASRRSAERFARRHTLSPA
jgi:hypothetical protein